MVEFSLKKVPVNSLFGVYGEYNAVLARSVDAEFESLT